MKRFRAFALALFLACTVTSAFAQGNTGTLPGCYRYLLAGAGHIFGDAPWTVYAQPRTDSKTAGTVKPGQHVHVEKTDRENGWAYIFFYQNDTQDTWNFGTDCKKGWILMDGVVSWDAAQSFTVVSDKAGERLHLRSKPSSSAPSLGKYYSGTVAKMLEAPKNGYVKVRIGHMDGYMDTKYLVNGLTCDIPELPELTVANAAGSGMSVRKLPKANSQIIKTVPNSAAVTVLGIRSDNWYQVMFEGEIGFAKSDRMTPKLDYHTAGNSSPTAGGKAMSVQNPNPKDRLNLREKPSSTAKSLGKFYNGTVVTVHKISDGWAYVTVGAQTGWMDTDYLKEPVYATDAPVPVQTLANVTFTQKPTERSISITGFSAGTVIYLFGDLNDGWHYAYYQGVWGYIHEGSIERDLNKDLSYDNSAAG